MILWFLVNNILENSLPKQAAVSLLYFEKYRKHWQTSNHVGQSSTIFGWSSLIVWWSSLGRCAEIVRSVRKDLGDVRKYSEWFGACSEKSLVILAYLWKASKWPETTFEKLRMTAAVFKFLRTINLKNLRYNLHLFFNCSLLYTWTASLNKSRVGF